MNIKSKMVSIANLRHNTGQIPDVPKNPRLIKDDKYKALVRSLTEDPEMLNLREVIAYPIGHKLVVVMGNMRLTAAKELGMTELPVKILPEETSAEKIRAYAAKDNVNYGEWDFDLLANEWDVEELTEWGVDIPAIDDDDVGIDSEPFDSQKEEACTLKISLSEVEYDSSRARVAQIMGDYETARFV